MRSHRAELRIVFCAVAAVAISGFIRFDAVAQQQRGVSIKAKPEAEEAPASPYRVSHALVVGIDKYRNGWPALEAAVSDARAMKQQLEADGFNVTLVLNEEATRTNLERLLLTELPKKVDRDGRFLFYFAGHGQTETSEGNGSQSGYLVPFDGARVGDEDQWHTYISMRWLNDQLTTKFKSRHVLAVFDSCFSGLGMTRGAATASVDAYLRKSGVNVLTAGGQGELANDGLFTGVFVRGLGGEADRNNDGFVTFSEVALYTEQEVNRRNPKQLPRFGTVTGEGQMVFGKGTLGGDAAKTPRPKVPEEPDGARKRTLDDGAVAIRAPETASTQAEARLLLFTSVRLGGAEASSVLLENIASEALLNDNVRLVELDAAMRSQRVHLEREIAAGRVPGELSTTVADVVAAMQVECANAPMGGLGDSSLVGLSCVLTSKAVHVSTGDVLYSARKSGMGYGLNSEQALQGFVEDANSGAADAVARALAREAAQRTATRQARDFDLVVGGVTSRAQLKDVASRLEKITGVRSLRQQFYKDGVVKFRVELASSSVSRDFVDALETSFIGLRVVSESEGVVTTEIPSAR